MSTIRKRFRLLGALSVAGAILYLPFARCAMPGGLSPLRAAAFVLVAGRLEGGARGMDCGAIASTGMAVRGCAGLCPAVTGSLPAGAARGCRKQW